MMDYAAGVVCLALNFFCSFVFMYFVYRHQVRIFMIIKPISLSNCLIYFNLV